MLTITTIITLLTALPPPSAMPLQAVISQHTTNLLSAPHPTLPSAQLALLRTLLTLRDAYNRHSWSHPQLEESIEALGEMMVQRFSHEDIELQMDIMQVLPLNLDEARKRDVKEGVKALLRRLLDEDEEDGLRILARVAEFHAFLEGRGERDEELGLLLRRGVEKLGANFGSGAEEEDRLLPSVKEEEAAQQEPEERPKLQPTSQSKPTTTITIKNEPSSSSRSQSPLAALFAERAAREEARQRATKIAERAEQRAKAQARKEAVAQDPAKSEQRKYAEEMKAKMEKEKSQKEHVLASIEADKIARREKAELTRLRRVEEQVAKEEKVRRDEELEKKLNELDGEMGFGDELEDAEEAEVDGEEVATENDEMETE